MKRKALSWLLAVALVFSLCPAYGALAAEEEAEPADPLLLEEAPEAEPEEEADYGIMLMDVGEEETVIPLSSTYEIYALANILNGESMEAEYDVFNAYYPQDAVTHNAKAAYLRQASFKLTQDVTLYSTNPTNSYAEDFHGIAVETPFTGTFDGGNHTITMVVDYDKWGDQQYFGLFGRAEDATIQNVTLVGSMTADFGQEAPQYKYLGSLVGRGQNCTFENITSSVDIAITATDYAGGYSYNRVGGVFGYLYDCTAETITYTDGTLSANVGDKQYAQMGGIAYRINCSKLAVDPVLKNLTVKDTAIKGEGYSVKAGGVAASAKNANIKTVAVDVTINTAANGTVSGAGGFADSLNVGATIEDVTIAADIKIDDSQGMSGNPDAALFVAWMSAMTTETTLKDLDLSGKIEITAYDSCIYTYLGGICGYVNHEGSNSSGVAYQTVTAQDVLVHDFTGVLNGGSVLSAEFREGGLIAGKCTTVSLENCLVVDTDLTYNGGGSVHVDGSGTGIGGVFGESQVQTKGPFSVKNVLSTANLWLGDGSSRVRPMGGFAGQTNNVNYLTSEGNLFSANYAGVTSSVYKINGVNEIATSLKGVAGFLSEDAIAIAGTNANGVAIAKNSSPAEGTTLDSFHVQWSLGASAASASDLLETPSALLEGMSVTASDDGNTLYLKTNNVEAGTYTLVPYVDKTIGDKTYHVKLSDGVTVTVADTLPTVSSVALASDNTNWTATGGNLLTLNYKDKAVVTAAVTVDNGTDANGVNWKIYSDESCSKEVGLATLSAYVGVAYDKEKLTVTGNRAVAEETTYYIKAISVTDPEKSAVFTLTLAPIEFIPTDIKITSLDDGVTGKGTERNPFVIKAISGGNVEYELSAEVVNAEGETSSLFGLQTMKMTVLEGKGTTNQEINSKLGRATSDVLYAYLGDDWLGLATVTAGLIKITIGYDENLTKDVYFRVEDPVSSVTITGTQGSESLTTDSTITCAQQELKDQEISLSAAWTLGSGNATLYAVKDASGHGVSAYYDLTENDVAVTWSTSDASVATIDSTGNVTLQGFGPVTFTASCGGVTKTFTLSIANTDNDTPDQLYPLSATSTTAKDGAISGLDSEKKYEYKTADGTEWISVPAGSTSIPGLTAGDYLVRCVDSENGPSNSVALTVAVWNVAHLPDTKGGTPTEEQKENGQTIDTTPDGIPDIYQARVELKVENGTWADGSTDPIVIYVTKKDKDGNPAETGTGTLTAEQIPAGMTPNSGYKGGGWSVDPTNEIKEDTTITYSFTRSSSGGGGTTSYIIEASAGDNGTISPNGKTSVTRGSDKTYTITPEEGYKISDVLVDGKSVGAVSTYTFENVTAAHTIQAVFEKLRQVADPEDTGVADKLNTGDHTWFLEGYPDKSFGPNRNMTRAEAAQMFYRLLLDKNVTATASFDDVSENAWYATAVNTLASMGIVKGVDDGTYAPNRSITRAEFTTIAMRFAKLDTSGENTFSDVSETDWFYDQIIGSIKYGWITGYEDGTFRPNNTITRAEVTAITNRMLGRAADESYVDSHVTELITFPDVASTYWAYYDIEEATNTHDYTKTNGVETWKN